jgi:hypothetical protein
MRIVGLPIAPPVIITSLFTPTVFGADVGELAYSTPDAVRLLPNRILVTITLVRMSRLLRGGRGSMYAEREYERVQLLGFIVDAAMNEPHVCPSYGSGLSGIPSAAIVGTQ